MSVPIWAKALFQDADRKVVGRKWEWRQVQLTKTHANRMLLEIRSGHADEAAQHAMLAAHCWNYVDRLYSPWRETA